MYECKYIKELIDGLPNNVGGVVEAMAEKLQKDFNEAVEQNCVSMDIRGLWGTFCAAEKLNWTDGVKELYDSIVPSEMEDYKLMAEMCVVLNWKIWEHHRKGQEALARQYDTLWRNHHNAFYDYYTEDKPNYKEAVEYYFNVTD